MLCRFRLTVKILNKQFAFACPTFTEDVFRKMGQVIFLKLLAAAAAAAPTGYINWWMVRYFFFTEVKETRKGIDNAFVKWIYCYSKFEEENEMEIKKK